MIGSTTRENKEPKARWWIWGPLGASIAFGGYGLVIHDYEIHARNASKLCDAMVTSGVSTQAECDKTTAIDYGNGLSRHIFERLSNSLHKTAP